MKPTQHLIFKLAAEDWEFEQIHRLNYRTFVEEIPQHERNSSERLVDKFHAKNTYAICLDGDQLAGMVAGRGERPFSLDTKLPNLDSYLPPGRKICEIRLLAVESEYRNGAVFWGLVQLLARRFQEQGYDLAIISGTVRQIKLYQHLGFTPFGPQVGSPEAPFQPMYLTLEKFSETAKALSDPRSSASEVLANFLPGPVEIHPQVREAFAQAAISHRSRAFSGQLLATKQALCRLLSIHQVEILVGSGSLANDVVAGQISLLRAPGLILSNGEFGERLIDHARRFGLEFEVMRKEWGDVFEAEEIHRLLAMNRQARWLWVVHCETSTGILNDLDLLRTICQKPGIKICADCVSSIGTLPVSLGGIYLASGASGKGLASYPGLSMVYYDHPVVPAPETLPRYLDLGFYATQQGIPFTHSSNLLEALYTALRRVEWPEKFQRLKEHSAWIRSQLRQLGYTIVGDDRHTSPAVITLALSAGISSRNFGWRLHKAGYLVSYRSEYLSQRNWVQICLMGEFSREQLESLADFLAHSPNHQPEKALREPAVSRV
jgi:aspartate aminotransferase-like enzyme/ribosomal protein S18 acetylase RimI-like enzyme